MFQEPENNPNPYSHLTAQKRTRLSQPASILLERGLLSGNVLDFGCGYGDDVSTLKAQGITITGYDPHYAPVMPIQKFDTIICFYVLNVLLPEEQERALMNIANLLKPGGKAYIAVSRGIKGEGFRMHRGQRKPVYQANVILPYASLYQSKSCEIYEYWHYTWLHRGNAAVSPFLASENLQELIAETPAAFAIAHPSPETPGHSLIIPKRITADYFELSTNEQQACWLMVNYVKEVLATMYNPVGFTIVVHTPSAQAHIELLPVFS